MLSDEVHLKGVILDNITYESDATDLDLMMELFSGDRFSQRFTLPWDYFSCLKLHGAGTAKFSHQPNSYQ